MSERPYRVMTADTGDLCRHLTAEVEVAAGSGADDGRPA